MAMDVYGKNPTAEVGVGIRYSIHGWHPLADYACEVAPEITAACKLWHSNDGDGLDAKAANKLADRLQEEIESGRTLSYERAFHSDSSGHPRLEGDKLTGRSPEFMASLLTGRSFRGFPQFRVRYVQDFVDFLRECGGFEIW